MATAKEELPVLGIQASCRYVRQVAVTYCHGTSVARSLKLLTLPQAGGRKRNNNYYTIYKP